MKPVLSRYYYYYFAFIYLRSCNFSIVSLLFYRASLTITLCEVSSLQKMMMIIMIMIMIMIMIIIIIITLLHVAVLAVIPRGGFRKLGRLQRSMFLSRRIKYYSNASCAFNPAVYKILRSGDVEINPGYVPECTTRPQRQDHTSELKVFYTNARSTVNKVTKLQVELANSQADIVVLTETHLDCSLLSEEVIGSDYTVYWKDHASKGARHGGGVLITTKKGMITSI